MKRFTVVILVLVACGLALVFGGIAIINRIKTPAPTSVQPSPFFNYCSSDVISDGFPAQFMTGGPSSADSSSNLDLGTGGKTGKGGGTVRIEQQEIRASTPSEADDMMRKFFQQLQKVAVEKGCQVENPAQLPQSGVVEHFQFSYAWKANRGEVIVTRTERTEKELQVADKQVYTVKFLVTEKIVAAP